MLALAAFVLIYLAGFASAITYPNTLQRILLLHIPLLAICGLARLRGIWVHQKMGQDSKRSKLKWWAIILFVGVCFTAVCVGMVLRKPLGVNLVHLENEFSDYEVLSFTHIGLAFLLISLGRSGLNRTKGSNPQKFFYLTSSK
jgi:hypothetical protein